MPERVFFRPRAGRTVPRPGGLGRFPEFGDWCVKDAYMIRRVTGPDPDGDFIPEDKIGTPPVAAAVASEPVQAPSETAETFKIRVDAWKKGNSPSQAVAAAAAKK